MSNVVFNDEKFYKELNAARSRRNITWNKLATRAGVSPTSVNSFVRNWEDPEFNGVYKGLALENVVKLMSWLGDTDLGKYMIDEDEMARVRANRRK